MKVKVWREDVVIPTYEIGKPEKNPVFLENRVYQGSSGKVYPYPVIEKISNEKKDKVWKAVYLENEFVKIMILPELGGRIQMAYDKTKERHFVYYNSVIKPALVGLTGPWISGGIEFNWPQHHRPSTYLPLDFDIEENEDGSKTIWCSEIERMSRTKGMTGFTLYPDKAYLEVKVKLYNRTPFPQTFLWWANPAVKVNDAYQSVFPPDVNAVFDHGKRDVSEFPIAKGTYYKVDYSPGTDISRYKNIPVPTSYMAINSAYNFVGGYENDSKGGLLHVADINVSTGKKQWTWGNGDFGKAWDRNLTDEDGPYIELMCGVFTDNQPDFSWMHPFEEKSFTQYFMPYRNVGSVKNATKEAILNLEFNRDKALIKFYTLGVYNNVKIILEADGKIFLEEAIDASPKTSFIKEIEIDRSISRHRYSLSLFDSDGNILVSYQPENKSIKKEIPKAAKAAKEPKDIKSVEQLYLRGLHLEQYRHATYKPEDYYLEALSRESFDVRNNNAMGLLLLRKGQFAKAEIYFRKAIQTLEERNPNPYEGEPYYNLGQSLFYQNRLDEAHKSFYKSAWNAAWQDASYFYLAQIAIAKNNLTAALDFIDRSLIKNWHNHKARTLKAAILRLTGKPKKALKWINESLVIDKFNFSILFENYLITSDENILTKLNYLMRGNIQNYIEFSLDYAAAGLYKEAVQLLLEGIKSGTANSLAYYFLGYYETKNGNTKKALNYFNIAKTTVVNTDFAYRIEIIFALKTAISLVTDDALAHYHLGNLWYDKKQYAEAIHHWEISRDLDPNFPTSRRNLALAYFNKKNDAEAAVIQLEKAFALDQSDARVFMELDQLYKRLNYPVEYRKNLLEKHADLVDFRDDIYLELCTLLNLTGKYKKALDLIENRKFHPWEGGEGNVSGQYLLSLTELAKIAIKNNEFEKAIGFLQKTEKYPDNLGEGKLYGTQENDIHYLMGCAFDGLNDPDKAKNFWKKASKGLSEPSAAVFYNDQHPDKIFYQGLALIKLNQIDEANGRFNGLINYGKTHQNDMVKIDYFAVSLPDLLIWEDDLYKRNKLHCHYLMGLGYLGLKDLLKAKEEFKIVFDMDNYHIFCEKVH